MEILGQILTNNVLPAFLVMAIGVLLDRKLQVDKKSLSRTAIYVLTPCLVFSSVVRSELSGELFGQMILYVLLITLIMGALAILVGYLFRWPARTSDALVLSTAFLNSGNFGLSIVLFSFGEQGLELATIFFVVSNFVCNTVAAFFAARGRRSTKQALLQVLKLPGPYAFLFALLVRALKIPLPPLLTKPISLIGQASVPIMLMMLGLQLSQTQLSRRYREISIGVFLRLCVGALVAIGLASAMRLEGLARQVAIVEASTPTAVSSGLMAIEFDADSEYVTSVIFFSTLLSSITLTLLLSFLG